MRAWLLAAAVLAIAIAAIAELNANATPSPRPDAPAKQAPTPTASPAPPVLPRSAVNRQDRVTAAHAARESRALDGRPLLLELPLELGPNRIDLAGLTAKNRVLLELTGPDRSAAEAAYRQALTALGDPGTTYDTRWTP